MPKSLPPPPSWVSPLHAAIVVACLAAVLIAASFQHLVVMGYAPEGRFYVVPTVVGLGFGLMLVSVRRVVVVNKAFGLKLAEKNERIETLNQELEHRVEERTAELSAKHKQLLQAQRLEMVGQLVGGVAHDLNNLLMVIRGNVDLLNVGDDDKHLVRDVVEAAELGQRLSNSLLATSRRAHAPTQLPLDQLVDELVGLLKRAFGKAYRIDVEHSNQPAPLVDVVRLEQILLNLLVNARDAQPNGGRIRVKTRSDGRGRIAIEVEDDGPGVPVEIRDRVFETYFTTKPKGEASGLGLSTVRLLTSEIGGYIELCEGHAGARFRVILPAGSTSDD